MHKIKSTRTRRIDYILPLKVHFLISVFSTSGNRSIWNTVGDRPLQFAWILRYHTVTVVGGGLPRTKSNIATTVCIENPLIQTMFLATITELEGYAFIFCWLQVKLPLKQKATLKLIFSLFEICTVMTISYGTETNVFWRRQIPDMHKTSVKVGICPIRPMNRKMTPAIP